MGYSSPGCQSGSYPKSTCYGPGFEPTTHAFGLAYLTVFWNILAFIAICRPPKWVPTHATWSCCCRFAMQSTLQPFKTYAIHKCQQVRSLPYTPRHGVLLIDKIRCKFDWTFDLWLLELCSFCGARVMKVISWWSISQTRPVHIPKWKILFFISLGKVKCTGSYSMGLRHIF